jgi:hypothetical protein
MKTILHVATVLSIHAGVLLGTEGRTNLAGVYRPITSTSSAEVIKLVINGDKSVDVELNVVEVQNSLRLGKVESARVEKKLQVAGRVSLVSPDVFFEGLKKNAAAPDADASAKKFAATCDLYIGLGYDSVVLISLPESKQHRNLFVFLHKDGVFVEFLTGAKLKKAWW